MTHQIFRTINSKYCDNIKHKKANTNIENSLASSAIGTTFPEYKTSTDICLTHFQFIFPRPNSTLIEGEWHFKLVKIFQKFYAAEKLFWKIAPPCVAFEDLKLGFVTIFEIFQHNNPGVIPLTMTCQKFWAGGNHPARWQHHSVCLVNTKWINLDHRHFIYHYPCYVWYRIRISPVF